MGECVRRERVFMKLGECTGAAGRYTTADAAGLAAACAEADRWHAQFHMAVRQRDELRAQIAELVRAWDEVQATRDTGLTGPDFDAVLRAVVERDPVRVRGERAEILSGLRVPLRASSADRRAEE